MRVRQAPNSRESQRQAGMAGAELNAIKNILNTCA
jgi:hypothetical protein